MIIFVILFFYLFFFYGFSFQKFEDIINTMNLLKENYSEKCAILQDLHKLILSSLIMFLLVYYLYHYTF